MIQCDQELSRIYNMLLQRIRIYPSSPRLSPFTTYSALVNYIEYRFTSKFMYSSLDWRMPLSSHPHFSITLMTLPWRSWRKGSGFSIWSWIDGRITPDDIVSLISVYIINRSFFKHHVPPVNVVYYALLMSTHRETIGIVRPEYFCHLFRQL